MLRNTMGRHRDTGADAAGTIITIIAITTITIVVTGMTVTAMAGNATGTLDFVSKSR